LAKGRKNAPGCYFIGLIEALNERLRRGGLASNANYATHTVDQNATIMARIVGSQDEIRVFIPVLPKFIGRHRHIKFQLDLSDDAVDPALTDHDV
jgi:hypothetical protein